MNFSGLDEIALTPGQPLQQQLYRIIVERIRSGRWPAATRLLSSRQLAHELAISRNTVNAVYEQLKSEGLLQSRPGSGVFVHSDIQTNLNNVTPTPAATKVRPEKVVTKGIEGQDPLHAMLSGQEVSPLAIPYDSSQARQSSDPIPEDNNLPFTPGLPDLAAFPIRQWNRTVHHHESRPGLLGYQQVQGYPPLREAIASYLHSARGVHCDPDDIIITHGAQQGLKLIAEVLTSPGDQVLMENPGYRGARNAFAQSGCAINEVPLQDQALDVSALPSSTPARLLYCTPTHQYPMGGILTFAKRLELLRWASATKTWIVEDDYDSEFHFYGKTIAALQGLQRGSPVIYLGSFSKTLFPSLRIGYLVVPAPLKERFLWCKRTASGASPLLMQAALAEFMETGQFTRHVRKMRQNYKAKWAFFHAQSQTQIGSWLTPVAESAGMHLVLQGAVNDVRLCHWLRTKGFGSAPLSAHYLRTPASRGLILGFASATEPQTITCLKTLRAALENSDDFNEAC